MMIRPKAASNNPFPPTVDITPFSKLKHLRKIGEGGYGEVYRAKHSDWSEVAYKKLVVNFINPNDRAGTELKKEVAVHIQLRHPNIITLMGVTFEPRNYGVILEYAPHGDLYHFMKLFKPIPWAWKLQIAYEISLGVNYIHTARDRPLIHGDLKCKNVLIGHGYKAKIGDFGLSTWRRFSFELSGHGSRGGTVTHIPPENWLDINEEPTEKYDAYSFAILLWELFSEKPPFSGCTVSKIKDYVVAGQRPSMSLLLPDVPDYVKEIISQCWVQLAAERPLFNSIKDRLERLCRQMGDLIHEAERTLQKKEHARNKTQNISSAARQPRSGVPVQPQENYHTHTPNSVRDSDSIPLAISVRDGNTVQSIGSVIHATPHPRQVTNSDISISNTPVDMMRNMHLSTNASVDLQHPLRTPVEGASDAHQQHAAVGIPTAFHAQAQDLSSTVLRLGQELSDIALHHSTRQSGSVIGNGQQVEDVSNSQSGLFQTADSISLHSSTTFDTGIQADMETDSAANDVTETNMEADDDDDDLLLSTLMPSQHIIDALLSSSTNLPP